tara:strand:- start:8419 stop:8622 length:204 start_codon:yes stop_codon:yes gene_type:complete
MSKDVINVKSNGLRNELKEIRKSIDKLANAILIAQTHTHYEKNINLPIGKTIPGRLRDNETNLTGTK